MTDSKDYRQFLENEFRHIRSELTEIKEQVKETNGTVHAHEKYIQYADVVIEANGNKTAKIVERLDKIDDDLEEYRIMKRYPKLVGIIITVFVVASIVAAYGTFRSTENAIVVKRLKKQVDMINTPVQNRDGSYVLYPSGMLADSLANAGRTKHK